MKNALTLYKKSKYCSLKEKEITFDQKLVYAENPGQNNWKEVLKQNWNFIYLFSIYLKLTN